jgi:serine/threonine protein kinase
VGPGTVLVERYLIDEELGSGDLGKVYVAEHLFLKKKLVIKVLRREHPAQDELTRRFEHEAMIAASLDHPHLAGAVDFGSLPNGTQFFVLEHVPGKTLRSELGHGPLALERSLHIARQVASALAATRDLDLLHGDLRPENLMLTRRGEDADFVKILDLALAPLRVDAAAEHVDTKRLPYLAPEQLLGQPIDARADLYSLGVILFEMLAGVVPYEEPASPGKAFEAPPTLAARAPKVQVPREVEQLLSHLIAHSVNERPPNAAALLESLDRLLGTLKAPGTNLAAPAQPAVIAKQSSPPEMSFSRTAPPPPPVRHPRPTGAAPSVPPPAVEPKVTKVTTTSSVAAVPANAPEAATAAPALMGTPAQGTPLPAALALAPPLAPATVAPATVAPATVAPATVAPATVAPATGSTPPAEPDPGSTLIDEDDEAPTRLALPKISVHPPAEEAKGNSPAVTPNAAPAAAPNATRSATPPLGQTTPPAARKNFWENIDTKEWTKRVKDRAENLYLDASISAGHWRDRAQERLRGRRERVIASTAGGALLGLLVIGFFALRSPSAGPTEASAAHAVGTEIEANKPEELAGTAVVTDSPTKTAMPPSHASPSSPSSPSDEVSIFLTLANTYSTEHRDAEAVALVSRELSRHPELKNDARVTAVLARTVRSDSRQVADESFSQLSGPMGERGAEIVYGVATDGSVRDSLRKRSEDWLTSKDFDRTSSAALYSAVKLRYAKSCEQKRALLPLAADVGGKQTLEYLRELDSRIICRANDLANCFPCLAGEPRLKDAISRVEKRVGS